MSTSSELIFGDKAIVATCYKDHLETYKARLRLFVAEFNNEAANIDPGFQIVGFDKYLTEASLQIARRPELWAKRMRVGASDARYIPDYTANHEALPLSAYQQLSILISNAGGWRAHRKFKQKCFEKLESLQSEVNEAFLFHAKHKLAYEIQEQLPKAGRYEDHQRLIASIKVLSVESVQTRGDVLVLHKKIKYDLAQLIRFVSGESEELIDNSVKASLFGDLEALAFITKRWLDTRYEDPVKRSAVETFRFVAKTFAVAVGFVFSTLGFIFLFVNPGLAMVFGFISMAGLFPVIDNLYEAARCLWHSRGLPKKLAKELSIVLPIMVVLVGGAQWMFNAPQIFARTRAAIKAVKLAGQDMLSYFLDAFGAAVNFIFGAVLGRQVYNIFRAVKPKPNNSHALALQLLNVDEKVVDQKVLSVPAEGYYYKSRDGVKSVISESLIYPCSNGLFAGGTKVLGLMSKIADYKALPIKTTVQLRCQMLTDIKLYIEQKLHSTSEYFDWVQNLEVSINGQREILAKISGADLSLSDSFETVRPANYVEGYSALVSPGDAAQDTEIALISPSKA